MICPGGSKQRQRLARDHEGGAQVDVELDVDLLRLLLRERPADSDAGAVHENIHSAVAFCVRRNDADALVGVAEVRGYGKRVEPQQRPPRAARVDVRRA